MVHRGVKPRPWTMLCLYMQVRSPELFNAESALPVNPGLRSPLLQNPESGSVRIGHRSRSPESGRSECGVRTPGCAPVLGMTLSATITLLAPRPQLDLFPQKPVCGNYVGSSEPVCRCSDAGSFPPVQVSQKIVL